MAVLRHLRGLVGNTKTISYSTYHYTVHDKAIISAIHPYLDFITLRDGYYDGPLSQETLTDIDFHGIPMSKIGIMLNLPDPDKITEIVEQVKVLGMAGVSLFSINSENSEYRGALAQRVAE